MNIDYSMPLEIADSIFWVGVRDAGKRFNCNPYLLRFPGEAVIIDPGSVLDFDEVLRKVQMLIPINELKYIILQHQDPDLCSSTPLFEKAGADVEIITHWRSSLMIKHYGVQSKFYLVDEHHYDIGLPSGRHLRFLHTPYLHFSGAIVTYDSLTKTLFSSDLFGAFTLNAGVDDLIANDNYLETMKAFHEHYMPGNDLLRPVMEMFLNVDILRIAPQHGSIIMQNVRHYIETLRDLECGTFLNAIRKQITDSGGYIGLCNTILKRYHAISGIETIIDIFKDTEITLNTETGLIADFNCSGIELWNRMFQIVYTKKGVGWLTPLEILVKELCLQYSISPPDIYNTALMDASKQAELLDIKFRLVQNKARELETALSDTKDRLIRDEATGLNNGLFFKPYLANILSNRDTAVGCFVMVSIDDLQRINFRYGNKHGTSVVKGIATLFKNSAPNEGVFAKLEGAIFALFTPGITKVDGIKWAEALRRLVRGFEGFIERITISCGVVHTDELPREMDINVGGDYVTRLYSIAGTRIRMAKKRGMDYVCSESSLTDISERTGHVLIAESEKINADVLRTVLEQMDLEVTVASDGETALHYIESIEPDIVISEVLLPKVDGFVMREKMLLSSRLRTIPFILLSHAKSEEAIQRAQNLDIVHFFKKPYYLSEVTGIVKGFLRRQETEI